MNIIVVGGMGFIGSRVSQVLVNNGHDVIVYDIKRGNIPVHGHKITVFDDICNVSEHRLTFQCADFIIHAAGLLGVSTLFDNIIEAERVNVLGSLSLLEILKDTGIPIVQVGMVEKWKNPYMITKHQAENWGFFYYNHFGVKYASLRFGHVYGPGQSITQGKAVPMFILKALRNEPLPVYGDGQSLMAMKYVNDCASIIAAAVNHPHVLGKSWDFHNPEQSLTVLELAELIIDISNSESTIEFLPMRKGQPGVVAAKYDAESANQYPFNQPLTPLIEGLKATVDWYREGM